MTLYQEAILEAKKLRELATEEAKNAILASTAPIIREIINKEIANSELYIEEQVAPDPAMSDPTATVDPTINQTEPAPTTDTTAGADLTPPPPEPAVAPTDVGTTGVSVDPTTGKMIVDIEQLFTATPPGQEPTIALPTTGTEVPPPVPAEQPPIATPEAPPVGLAPSEELPPPEPEAPIAEEEYTYKMFKEELSSLDKEIKKEITSGRIKSAFVCEALLNNCATLNNKLNTFSRNKVSETLHSLSEGRLSLLFEKVQNFLCEQTIYKKQEENVNMKKSDLFEFTKSMFMESTDSTKGHAGFGDGGEAPAKVAPTSTADKLSEKEGSHAKGASMPQAKPLDPGKKDSLTVKEDIAKLEEELKALTEVDRLASEDGENTAVNKAGDPFATKAEGYSTDEEGKKTAEKKDLLKGESVPAVKEEEAVLEINEKELKMEVIKLQKEHLARKIKTLQGQQKKLSEALEAFAPEGEEEIAVPKEEEVAMTGEEGVPGKALAGEDINININISPDDLGVNVDGEDVFDIDDLGTEPEGDMSFGAGETEVEPSDVSGPSNEPEVVPPPEGEEGEEEEAFNKSRLNLSEARNKALKEQLAETQLLMTRSIYVNKCFVREGLTQKQKEKIVEYLDTAKTVQEAKSIYTRIKNILDESKAKNNTNTKKGKVVGSSSAVSKPAATLSESVDYDKIAGTPQRWQVLAGIKPRA